MLQPAHYQGSVGRDAPNHGARYYRSYPSVGRALPPRLAYLPRKFNTRILKIGTTELRHQESSDT
jgi:hypothetical protein